MRSAVIVLALVSAAPFAEGNVSMLELREDPISKIISMLSDLQAKVIKEGEVAQKEYDEYAEWCEEESKNLQFEIKTAKAKIEELKATIEDAISKSGSKDEEIGELSASIATDEADLKAATEIRTKEHADFAVEEAELVDVVDTLERAIGILEKEMSKGGAAFVQIANAKNLAGALQALVEASALSSKDASKLTALIQNQQQSAERQEDAEWGAPDPAVYKSKSGSIVDVLEDLQEKAETQLADLRKKETNA